MKHPSQASPRRWAALAACMLCALTVSCGGGGGGGGTAGGGSPTGGTTPGNPTSPAAAGEAYAGTILLGAPQDTRVHVKLHSADQSGSVQLSWGLASADEVRGPAVPLVAGEPLEFVAQDLQPGQLYRWRIRFTRSGSSQAVDSPEYRWRTARLPGSTFTFTIQADSHLDENSDLAVYHRTLDNVLQSAPDFHVDLGDTFMTEKHSEALTSVVSPALSAAIVDARYLYERAHFGRITHSVPLFLVNGNHDAELGWLYAGQGESLPVWATKARKRFFLNPPPGAFYSGDMQVEPFTGERAAWYAWRWGDAHFIVLDPFWNSRAQASRDPWNLTLGERQFRWLEAVLQSSPAAHKFVFIHNLVGGLDGQMRGGIEAAPFYEWGGRHTDGSAGFAVRRPGWSMPIHELLVKHKVTAVFHGHDHFYARQVLDGVVYQLVPQPSAKNSSNGAQLAAEYRYASGTFLSSAGHLRVTVSPQAVTGEYVRTWLPAAQTATRLNGQVDDRWTVSR